MDETVKIDKVSNGYVLYYPDPQVTEIYTDLESVIERIKKYFYN